VHGRPQDAHLDAVPACVRVRWVCVRDHGGLEGVPDVSGVEHGLLRGLSLTRGIETHLARGGDAAREGVGRVGAAGHVIVIAPRPALPLLLRKPDRGGHWLLEQTTEDMFENDAPSLEDADEKIPYPETLPGLIE
jgi:hypothetical protein